MRVYALWVFVAAVSLYAWRYWYRALCVLILLMAVIEHEDMPKNVMGVQGFNPWNVLLVAIIVSWLVARKREGLVWDLPGPITALLVMYLGVVLVGFARAVAAKGGLNGYPLRSMISEELVNTIKWVVPGLLIFHGCRDRRRLIMAVACVLGVYFLLTIQVARNVPAASVFEVGKVGRMRLIVAGTGYSACDMSAVLAGASWGIIAMLALCRRTWQRVLLVAAAGFVVYAQALTGGRAGYFAWAVIGLTLCLLRWRRYLLLAPIVIVVICLAFPGTVERTLTGFGQTDVTGRSYDDDDLITSNRTKIWPFVLEKIGERPIFGHGRRAMQRTGLTRQLEVRYEEDIGFTHAHNIYLESLLDNGIAGTLPVLAFFGVVVVYSARLFRDGDPLCEAVGGAALAFVLAQLAAGIGAQHFYPEESTVGMWVGVFLVFRVTLERSRVRAVLARPAPVYYVPPLSGTSPAPAG